MKSSELHRLIKQNGWVFSHAEGSHYFYTKNGALSPPVPYHGSKEVGKGLEKKIKKEMGLV
jgi:mRNA interferase HicA